MNFKDYINELNEGIIVPEKLNINTLNVDKLNKKYNKKNIYFTLADVPDPKGSFDNTDGTIKIEYSDSTSLDQLEATVNHEVIHSIQSKLSKGNFDKTVHKKINKMNDIIQKLMDMQNDGSAFEDFEKFSKVLATHSKLNREFTFNSSEEKMAYAYTIIKMRKVLGLSSVNHIVKWFKANQKDFNIDKKLLKYIGSYWLVRDEL